ncbi:hypothetical protein [Paenibacillus sp. IHBB 3054]|uniref:hypothetical protein n=1 Tax=Paenibacillus sp. IHBB 3054 TaxID=3425689 RepID=UPI003F662408
MNSDVLIESVSLRDSYAGRVDALNKVKALKLLPDNECVSVEMAAKFYEVSRKTIDSLIFDNRQELESDGLKVLSGDELIFFKEKAIIGKMVRSFTVIPRRAILRVGMLLRDSMVARSLRDHLLDTEAEATRRARTVDPDLIHFKKEAYMLEIAADMLRLPDSGRLKLLGDFNKQHGLNVPIPAYADEPLTRSATSLLQVNGAGISTERFNNLMIHHGLLEILERPSKKSGIKEFKSLTDAGLEYGKNIVSPNSPRETAPHYFPDRFPDLLKKVGLLI